MTAASDPVLARAEAAEAIARAAGATARRFFDGRGTLTIEKKTSAQDLVSEADRTVEDEIRAAVAARFPEDGILGEEHGLKAGTSGFTWVVDPIDGTQPFLTGQPNWCVSIAVTGPDGIVAGVIHAPVLGETYTARRGAGAFLNGQRLAMDPSLTLKDGNIGFGPVTKADPALCGRFTERLYREGGVFFRIGSGAIMLAYVASGRLAGYVDPNINCWDCYAGILLVEEAGGAVSFSGDMTREGALFSGPAGLVPALIRLAA